MANSVAYKGILGGDITCYALTHGKDRPCDGLRHPCPLRKVKESAEPSIVEHIHLDRDGNPINVEVHAYPIFDAAGKIVQMVEYTLDITERKQIETQRQRLAVLEERERIGRELHDDLGQVMAYVNVQAQAALARLEKGDLAETNAILNQVMAVASDAHDDVRQHILGIRTAADQPPLDFFTALERYLESQRQRYSIEVQVSLPEEWPQKLLSPQVETQLLRIIQEALANVRKHAGVDTARLLFTCHTGEMQLIIEDSGGGFETANWGTDKAVQTVNDQSPENHFGLSIMRERAEAVDGSLEVRSTPGKGTQIFVRVPCIVSPTLGEEGLEHNWRVLLVDDHPLFLNGLRNMLSARGMQVVGMASDGLEAQTLARELRPDLILMDVHMPRCNGLKATRRIKAELPETTIVMLTMAAEDDMLFGALKNGASGYLLKSLDGPQFFSLLVGAMRGETVLSPALAGRVLAEFTRHDTEPAADEEELPILTARQQQVLELVSQGQSNKEIASALHISERTVKYHVSQVLERLHLKNRYELAQYVQQAETAPS